MHTLIRYRFLFSVAALSSTDAFVMWPLCNLQSRVQAGLMIRHFMPGVRLSIQGAFGR